MKQQRLVHVSVRNPFPVNCKSGRTDGRCGGHTHVPSVMGTVACPDMSTCLSGGGTERNYFLLG